MGSRLLVLGASSRIGFHLVGHPPEGWTVDSAGRTDPRTLGLAPATHAPLDLGEEGKVRAFLRACAADAWVNLVARTDVDGVEPERPAPGADRPRSSPAGSAWQVNAELPRWIAEEAERAGRFFVQLSTDFVFDGEHGPYAEETRPSPLSPRLSWYGYTKGVGEAAVLASRGPRAVLRVAYPYGTTRPGRTDLALTLLRLRSEGKLYPLYTDQQISPTWVPDVREALAPILQRGASRVYHLASPELTTPFEFASTLFQAAGGKAEELRGGRLADANPPAGRAPRPLRGGLRVSELPALGVRPRTFREGIRLLVEGGGPAGPKVPTG